MALPGQNSFTAALVLAFLAIIPGMGIMARGAEQERLAEYLRAACDFDKVSEPARQSAEKAVIAAGAAALPLVLPMLQSGTTGQKQMALSILGHIGSVEQEALILRLWQSAQEDYFVRNSARGALPALYARFAPALLAARIATPAKTARLIFPDDPATQANAEELIILAALYGAFQQGRALEKLPPEIEAATGAHLRDSIDPAQQAACATVLRFAHSSQAVGDLLASASALYGALKKDNDESKALALVEICRAIEQIRPAGQAKAIEELASCGVPLVEVAALGALGAMGYKNAGNALALIAVGGGATYGKAGANEAPAGAYPPISRAEAVQLLARYDGILHLTELVIATKDPSPEVRLAAVRALGALAAPQSAKNLREVMEVDRDPLVRAAAAVAFAKSGQVGALTPLLRDAGMRSAKHKEYRLAAIDALAELKAKEGLRVLLEGLEDADADVVAACADALSALGDRRAGKALYLRWQAEREKITANPARAAVAAALEAALIQLYGQMPDSQPQ